VAAVTGAASGIGRATALVLARAGAVVHCADLDGDGAAQTAQAIRVGGGTAEPHQVDVADAGQVESFIAATVAANGRIDICCNIAGIMVDGMVLDTTETDLDRIWAVNLKGTLHCCQAAGRRMVDQGSGAIVNTASTAVLAPSPGVGAYAMTKAAIVQLTRIMATEVGRSGVRVNAIAPGFVPTKNTSRYYSNPDGTENAELRDLVVGRMAKLAPLGRVGTPEEIASCILFLVSDAAAYVTGQVLSPNGGMV
jgi:3-oxoacyl-[acyl-carrier protein] reductase